MKESKINLDNIPCVDISVVIPCYKCSQTIERAVKSVWEQTLRPKEVILIEDCSDDQNRTKSKIIELCNTYPDGWVIAIFLDVNGGPGNARNIGWGKATGKYIAFLDADDAWHKNKIEIQYDIMERNPQLFLCGHQSTTYTEEIKNTEVIGNEIKVYKVSLKNMFISNRFMTRTVMLKRDIPIRFDSLMYRAEDFLLWCMILASGRMGGVFNAKLSFVFESDAITLTSNLKATEQGELLAYKKMKQSGIITGLQYLLCYSFSLLKYGIRIIKNKRRKYVEKYKKADQADKYE